MKLTATLLQTDIAWEDAAASVREVRRMAGECAPAPGGMIILPEMYATGFSMNVPAVAAVADAAREGLRELAKETGCLVMGGVACACEGDGEANDGAGEPCWGWNEAFAFGAGGELVCRYRKVRTFSYTDESYHYRRGREIVVFDFRGWRVCPLICYDLRFPELFRAGLDRGAELFVVMANWPDARIDHWVTLLRARAIENQAWVAGVNRVGKDPRYVYPGRSIVVDPHGVIRADAGGAAGAGRCELDREVVRAWRETFPAWKDRVRPEDMDP